MNGHLIPSALNFLRLQDQFESIKIVIQSITARLLPSISISLSTISPFQELSPAEKDAALIQSNSLYLFTRKSN